MQSQVPAKTIFLQLSKTKEDGPFNDWSQDEVFIKVSLKLLIKLQYLINKRMIYIFKLKYIFVFHLSKILNLNLGIWKRLTIKIKRIKLNPSINLSLYIATKKGQEKLKSKAEKKEVCNGSGKTLSYFSDHKTIIANIFAGTLFPFYQLKRY